MSGGSWATRVVTSSGTAAMSASAVSNRTVNAHLRSISRKIGVRSRAAAGRFAEENDLF
jgi:Bacterial regulatory proteins, luxR family